MRAYLAESLGAFFVVFTFLGTSTTAPAVTALAVGSVLAASVWVGAHVSGAHFNPAVSLGAFLRHRLSLADLWSYWAAQLGGAFVAALVGMAVFRPVRHGLDVSQGPALLPALLGEFVFTFALVYVVLSVAASRTQEHDVSYGVAAGAVVLVGSLAVAGLSGAAFNPAVVFAMTVDGEFAWPAIWVYLAAELSAAVAASACATRALPSDG